MTSDAATNPWDQIAFYLRHALSLFGAPEELAKRVWLNARDHKLFSNYIRPLEAMVGRLIFIAALERAPMTLPPTPERKFRERRAMPANTGASFDPDKPETWRASFKLAAQTDRRLPAGNPVSNTRQTCRQDAGGPSAPIASAPSAQRLEALLRAYENRDALAAKLARKIARNAALAQSYITRPRREHTRGPVYLDPLRFLDDAQDAFERFTCRKLAAAPDSS